MSSDKLNVLSVGKGACGVPRDGRSKSPSSPVFAEDGVMGNVLIVTLGCAKNLVDSEVMLGSLRERGYRPVTEPASADLILVNTCAFLQSAVEEGIDRILELAEYKSSGRCRKLVVAGCMVERYRHELEESLPEVDRFVSTDEIVNLDLQSETTKECFDDARRPYFLYDESMPRVRSTSGHTAYVKVAEGCDRPCSFCIIPKIRGAFRSRTVDSIVAEAEDLRDSGVREINLVAQDLTAYGSDRGKAHLGTLLEALDRILQVGSGQSQNWVRLLYAYPIGLDAQLLEQIISLPSICNYIDLPLQHISHPVLKAMRRPLGGRRTRELIENISGNYSQIALRTTFIVGFPGETEEDIQQLEEFVAAGHFTHVGTFPYSQEKEAQSYTMPNQIAEEEKAERVRRIMEAQQKVVARRNEATLGKVVDVLVDGLHRDTDLLLTARAEWQAPETDGEIIVNDADEGLQLEGQMAGLVGEFVKVEITEVAGYDLVGRVVSR